MGRSHRQCERMRAQSCTSGQQHVLDMKIAKPVPAKQNWVGQHVKGEDTESTSWSHGATRKMTAVCYRLAMLTAKAPVE
eukprot:10621073-Alexandrium_andersonii.AAC.1